MNIQADGYQKFQDRRLNKFYVTRLLVMGNGRISSARFARRIFRRAGDAAVYGLRLTQRYARFCASIPRVEALAAEVLA